MEMKDLGLSGRVVIANCGLIPSENNCKVVIMAPESQKEDLLEASVSHAIHTHSHEDSPALRKTLEKLLQTVEM